MKRQVATLASMLLAAGCGGGDSSGSGSAVALPAPVGPAPTPTPTPAPTPTPTPAPTPTPTPTPTASPASYLQFSDIYIYRLGASVSLPSACSGFEFAGQPPAVLPASPYGQGLGFRFVITPQVWAVSGAVAISFDGRDADAFRPGEELALAKVFGGNPVRFSVVRPVAGVGLDYARLAAVATPVQGVERLYQCVVGIPTLVTDFPAAPSVAFTRGAVLATAYVRDGATTRAYSLSRSTVAIAADLAGRRVTISLRLIGTPTAASGPDVDLGTVTASAPIDPTTGNFVAALNSPVTGTISGRFFGPQAVEVGAAFGGTAPGLSFAGAVYGAR